MFRFVLAPLHSTLLRRRRQLGDHCSDHSLDTHWSVTGCPGPSIQSMRGCLSSSVHHCRTHMPGKRSNGRGSAPLHLQIFFEMCARKNTVPAPTKSYSLLGRTLTLYKNIRFNGPPTGALLLYHAGGLPQPSRLDPL